MKILLKIPIILLAGVVMTFLHSCASSPSLPELEKQKYDSISLPVSRSQFVKQLGLKESQNVTPTDYFNMSGIRGGKASYCEMWKLSNGNIIRAYDTFYVGEFTVIEDDLSFFLNNPSPPQKVQITKLKKVNSFHIENAQGDLLYRSEDILPERPTK